jgi:hypothetical protein
MPGQEEKALVGDLVRILQQLTEQDKIIWSVFRPDGRALYPRVYKSVVNNLVLTLGAVGPSAIASTLRVEYKGRVFEFENDSYDSSYILRLICLVHNKNLEIEQRNAEMLRDIVSVVAKAL